MPLGRTKKPLENTRSCNERGLKTPSAMSARGLGCVKTWRRTSAVEQSFLQITVRRQKRQIDDVGAMSACPPIATELLPCGNRRVGPEAHITASLAP